MIAHVRASSRRGVRSGIRVPDGCRSHTQNDLLRRPESSYPLFWGGIATSPGWGGIVRVAAPGRCRRLVLPSSHEHRTVERPRSGPASGRVGSATHVAAGLWRIADPAASWSVTSARSPPKAGWRYAAERFSHRLRQFPTARRVLVVRRRRRVPALPAVSRRPVGRPPRRARGAAPVITRPSRSRSAQAPRFLLARRPTLHEGCRPLGAVSPATP